MERGNISLDDRHAMEEDGGEESETVAITICSDQEVHLRLAYLERKKGRKKHKIWLLDVHYASDDHDEDDEVPGRHFVVYSPEYAFRFDTYEEAFAKHVELMGAYIKDTLF